MTCREFADFIADYLSGELAAGARSAFDHHLQLCPNCRTYLAGYAETVKLGKRAFESDDAAVLAEIPDELVQAILDARNRR